MELRLDMCQKLIPYIYKTVTLETASHGSLVGNPVQTDIMRSVLTVLLPNGQMDIPLDDILSISCFGMETLRFDNAASAQPAAPAVPTTPAPVPSSPVAPAAPPVAEEPVAAPEPVNPLELAPKKEPQKQLTELLIDGDLSAALALATEPEALQHQGYTEEETAQITAQLRADKLPNGHTPEAIAQRLWRVVGNHAGLAKQYARKALPGTLSLCFSICEAEKNWDAIAELGKQYPENVQGEITMLRSYALALQNSGKNEELLALAAANPVVLHQKTLYPALGELAKNYSDTKPEEAALIAEAAVHVNAYPDREVRTPFERLLLGDYDENALRPYRGANCVEMLCKQGYTAEQAAKIADRMPRINADTYELERGARLAVAQENIHYLSEYYLWEELLTSPDKAVGRLALHMQGNTGTDANGQPIGKRDAEYIQLYRVCIAPNRKTYDSNLRYTQLYLGALLRSGQNEEALAVADTCWTACTDAGLLTKIIEIAEQTDKNRYETLIQHCSSQMKKRRANEFEQMLLSMDRRMMDYVSRPEQLEQMGYDKATVQMICTNLPKVNNYPSGNAPVQQYERVYYVQGNANGQAERCLRKAIQKETNESRKKQLTAVLFAMLCKEQRLAEAAEHLPTDEEMMAQMHSTTSLWYFRTLYAIKDYTRYCKLYDACRTLPTAVICNPKNMGLRDVCETLRARIYTGHEIDNFSALWAGAINPFVLSKAPNREQLKETLAALNTQAYLPQLAYALGVLAEECYRMNPNHLRDVAEVLLPQGAKAIPETLVTALPRAAENGQQALDMLILLELAQADYAACARAVTWFRGMLRDAFLSGTAEPICDTIGVWVGQLVPMLQRCELPAAATQLSYIGWLYVIQRLHGGHTPDAAVDWLFGEDVLIPMPKNFPEKEKDALTNWAMKDYPEKCALLLNKYPELSKYGLKAASSPLPEQEEAAAIPAQAAPEAEAPAQAPVAQPEAPQPAAPEPAAEAEPQAAQAPQEVPPVPAQEKPAASFTPAEQYKTLTQLRADALQAGDTVAASMYLQVLCRSDCLASADILTRGSLADAAAKEPPMLYWLQQAAENDSESVSKFLERWSTVATAYVSFDFSDQVSELMLQLDQNAAVSTEAQNVLVWAILTNSSRKNAAWSLLQRTQANPHARAQTFYCAAVDDAQTWQAALRLFWQEGEYMFFLRGLVHRFNQASELAERMQYSDNLQEMCDKNVFAEMDRQQLQKTLRKLYPAVAQSYLATESWTVVQTIRYVSFCVGGQALNLYYDVFAVQYPIITEKLPMEGCAFLARLGTDPATYTLMQFIGPQMLAKMKDPDEAAGAQLRLPSLMRELYEDCFAVPRRCTEQEEQDVYSLILPDAFDWNWRHFGEYYCRKMIESPEDEASARRVLLRFATKEFHPDAFLMSIEFYVACHRDDPNERGSIVQLMDRLLRVKARDNDATRAMYVEYAILWLQRCPGSTILDGQDPAEWFLLSARQNKFQDDWIERCRRQYADILKSAPKLHTALATGNWQPCFDLLIQGGEEAEKLRLALVGVANGTPNASNQWTRCTVWQSLPHELVGTLAGNLLAGTPEKNDALKAVFAPMATLPLLRSFRDIFQWYEEYLRKGDAEDLRWVENCAALPMQETQFFFCALGQHKADCTKEQAEFRSRALEMMGAPSTCTTWREQFSHTTNAGHSAFYIKAMTLYNNYTSTINPTTLHAAIQFAIRAYDVEPEKITQWSKTYTDTVRNWKRYFSNNAVKLANRSIYAWAQLLGNPDQAANQLLNTPPDKFVNMIAYLFLFCDRTRELAKKYYPLMRREQVAAVQVLVAILLPKPELIDPCIEKLCATAKGAQYMDAIKGVLLESMHTPPRSQRIKWDADLCEIVKKLGIEYDHNTPNDESRYFRIPAEDPSRIAMIRARIRLMLARSGTNYVFADPKDVCREARKPEEKEEASQAAAPAAEEKPAAADSETADSTDVLAPDDRSLRVDQCRQRVMELFSSESETADFKRAVAKEKDLSLIYMAGAELLAAEPEPSAASIVRCLVDAAKNNLPTIKLESFSRALICAVRATAYDDLQALRIQLQDANLFTVLKNCPPTANPDEEDENKNKALQEGRRLAYRQASLTCLQEYLKIQPIRESGRDFYDEDEQYLMQEQERCSLLQRTPAEQDRHELVRMLAEHQQKKLDARPQMKVYLDPSSAYYCTRDEDDYSYDDPCEPTTLQGYVENVGGCPLQPVYINLSYRIRTGEKEWDAAALPIPRSLTLRGGNGNGNAVLLSKQQYTDEDQKALWHIPFQIDTDIPEKTARRVQEENAEIVAVVEVRALVQSGDDLLLYRGEMPLQFLPENQKVRVDHTIRDTKTFFGRRNELSRLHTLYCENPSRIPMLFLISGQFRMGKSMITQKLQKMIQDETNGQVIPLRLEVVQSSDQQGASENLRDVFSNQLWDQLTSYMHDETLPQAYRDEETIARVQAHRKKWEAYFAQRQAAAAPAPQRVQYLPNPGVDIDSEENAPLDISALSAGISQGVVYEDLRWLPQFCRELCAALGNRHIVYILDEADRLINDLETVGGAAASNLRAVLQSDTPFHLLICGANGLTEYYLRGGSMTQLFECTYGRPMIIGQMAKEEWRTATSSLIDTVDLESNFRALDQLWFYTRGLIHPAYLLMDTCFTYLDNFPSVQPAPNGKTTLYAARVLEATNAMLCSSPQQLHMDKLIDSLSDDSNDLWRSVLTCLMRECTIPYQWVPVTVLESIVDESAGITWDKISNVLSNLVSYRGLLEYSARRRSYRPQCELYRQILRNKLLPDCKLQPYPYFKPRKEGH